MGLYLGETLIEKLSVIIEGESGDTTAAAITVDADGIASKSGTAFTVDENGILAL